MKIERLNNPGHVDEWENTDWRSLIEIALNENATNVKYFAAWEYYYLVCLYNSEMRIYGSKIPED